MNIKNVNYRQFLDTGIIQLVMPAHLAAALDNVTLLTKDNTQEGRALIIALYYTGGRPAEVLNLKREDINEENSFISIQMKGGVKHSLPRKILIGKKKPFIKELLVFSKVVMPGIPLFRHYEQSYIRKHKKYDGSYRYTTQRTTKVYYFVKKWFKGVIDITPYILRHSKISKLMEKGASYEDARQLKGARSLDSVLPYAHMSKERSRKISKFND